MEDLSTFLELPLDRDLYSPKLTLCRTKPPLTVLITGANTKIANNLIYKICSGEVFGPDQNIILHLTLSSGKLNVKKITNEIYHCGFPVILDVVADVDPKVIYKNVDLVVEVATFEYSKHSAQLNTSAFAEQILLTLRAVGRVKSTQNMVKYSKKNSKLVICGPSTKGTIVLLNVLGQMNLEIRDENISGVTILDETIAKSMIAAKLKTTTNHIKNVVIWGGTHADVRNGTVFTYPPDDRNMYKKVEIPLSEAIQDDNWMLCDLLRSTHKRVISPHLVISGKAVAVATAAHLRHLFQGSDVRDETFSMGVIIPSNKPYALSPGLGFSVPVTTKNGHVTVKQNVQLGVNSFLANLKDEYSLTFSKETSFSIQRLRQKKSINAVIKTFQEEILKQKLQLQYIICTLPTSAPPRLIHNKSVRWEELPEKFDSFCDSEFELKIRFADFN